MNKSFCVLGEPKGKARARVTRFGTYTPEATVMYENLVKIEYRRQCADYRFGDGPLKMTVTAHHGMPKSASKKKREQMLAGVVRPLKTPDLTNIVKAIEDALNGIAYRDDAQISCIIAERFYSDVPRVSVYITSLSEPRQGA